MIPHHYTRNTIKQNEATSHRLRLNAFQIATRPIEPGELDPEHVLTPEELAKRLKLPVSWVYENTRQRAKVRNADPLPCIRLGKYLRFYWPEIEKWLERRQAA